MNKSNILLFKKLFGLIIVLLIFVLLSGNSYAQLNSLKQLKQNAKDLNVLKQSIKPSDPWTIDHLITTDELAQELKNTKGKNPVILQVGFKFLYNTGHIPEAKYVGPASEKSGIKSIKDEVKSLKKNRNIVIYCGCCPWGHCPNVRPAYKTLKELGYTNVKVLYIPQDFGKDWADVGYPVSK
jgi:rhodanese-related sulfurtransferase